MVDKLQSEKELLFILKMMHLQNNGIKQMEKIQN